MTNLRAAIEAQPDNGVAHALLAMQLSQNLVSGWIDDPAATAGEVQTLINSANRLTPNDSRVLMTAGIVALMQGEHAAAVRLLERSLAQNPNEPHTLAELGMARFFETAELPTSIAMIEEAKAAAPHHPRYTFGRIDAAFVTIKQAISAPLLMPTTRRLCVPQVITTPTSLKRLRNCARAMTLRCANRSFRA